MMISDEQGRLAAHTLGGRMSLSASRLAQSISPDVIEQARRTALASPDFREDRVIEARSRLDAGLPDAHDIAGKIVSRAICDELR
jgi:hypothetical protein